MATKPKLTDKQENFAIAYTTNGNNASKAYRECYDVKEDASDGSVWVQAHELLHSPKVSVRVEELRKQKFKKKILSIEERKVLLCDLIEDGDTKAHEILNKMEGVYIEKKQVEHSGPDGKPIETKWTVEFKEAEDGE